ncbi:hypothetical protein LguiB_020031 [Lonicera macranthoides]
MGEYAGSKAKKWWEWRLAWILSKKPTFASNLEISEEETSILESRNKGSWRHVFYKVRSELRQIVRPDKVFITLFTLTEVVFIVYPPTQLPLILNPIGDHRINLLLSDNTKTNVDRHEFIVAD